MVEKDILPEKNDVIAVIRFICNNREDIKPFQKKMKLCPNMDIYRKAIIDEINQVPTWFKRINYASEWQVRYVV